MIFPDKSLATRFEHYIAQDMQGYVHTMRRLYPDVQAEVITIAGGVAICMGKNALNIAVGMGMSEVVTADDIDQLEAFFGAHQIPVPIVVTAFTDESLLNQLYQRGYGVVDFNTAYTHDLQSIPDNQSDVVVKPIDDSQKDVWVQTVTDISPEDGVTDTKLAEIVTERPETICFLATLDGVPAGASALSLRGDSAICYFSATRTGFRNRGVQTATIQARLQYAKSQGCEMVLATSNPGVQSMRNLLRAGFQVAYTRIEMQKNT